VEDVAVNLNLKLPRPGDVHSIVAKVRHTSSYNYFAHALHYMSQEGQDLTGSSGEVSFFVCPSRPLSVKREELLNKNELPVSPLTTSQVIIKGRVVVVVVVVEG